jgi:hypothetical protein
MTGFNNVLPDKEGDNFLLFKVYFPYPPLLFEEKKKSLFILVFFLHFKTKIPKKKDMVWICGWPSFSLVYAAKAYWTFVLFLFSVNNPLKPI